MDGGKAGEVYYDARLNQDELRADYKAAEAELARSGKVGGDAFGEGLEQGAKEGAAAVRSESKKAADATEKNLGGAATRVREGFSKAQMALAAIGVTVGLAAVTTFLGGAINAASDLNETVSKSAEIFGKEYVPALEEWADTASDAFGQSKRQALDGAATFAIFGKSAGLAGQDLVGFSQELTELASDLASFHNASPEEAIQAIGAALRGESEPIRRFGVLLDDATLRARAFEEGIISSTKNALTPQQRVLAAHAEIMAQTSDAQGDFARTAEGLANSQRTLAAQFEDAQARIGQALLPVAAAMVDLAANVLPALVDGFLALFDTLGPIAGALGDLAGLWIEHADKILPVLITVLGIRYVTALKRALDNTDLLEIATRRLSTALLLGIPLIFEGAEALGDFIRGMGASAVEVDRLEREIEAFGNAIYTAPQFLKDIADEANLSIPATKRLVLDFYETTGATFADLDEESKRLGVGWADLARAAMSASRESGMHWTDFLVLFEGVMDGTAEHLQEGAARWSQTVAGQRGPMADAAAPLADAISGPLEQGADDGVSAIEGMFTRIAAAIAEREQQLRDAGGDAVDAWLEPQMLGYEVAALESELASQELRDNLKSKDPEIRRDAQQRRLEITAELIKLRQAQATTGDEMSQIAAQKSILTSQFMRDGLLSEDPEIRALFRAWQAELEESIGEMESDARRNRTGPNFRQGIDDATPGVHGAIRNLGNARPDTSWAYNSGYGLGSSFAAGMAAWVGRVKQVSIDLGDAAATGIRLRSPAKEGALSEPAGRWSSKLIADFLAPFYSIGIPEAAAASKAMAASVAGGLIGGQLPGLAFAGAGGAPGAMAPAAVGETRIQHFHLYFEGKHREVDSPFAAVEEAQRMGMFEGDR